MAAVLAVFLWSSAASAQTAPSTAAAPPPAPVRAIMRGILFINANVVFSVQSEDPAAVKPAPQASAAVNPLVGTFGGWEAVDNAALALVEVTKLLEMPRNCSNGKPVPVKDAEWQARLDALRAAGRAAYAASQSRSQDAVSDVTERLAMACTGCHRVYASQDQSRRCQSTSK